MMMLFRFVNKRKYFNLEITTVKRALTFIYTHARAHTHTHTRTHTHTHTHTHTRTHAHTFVVVEPLPCDLLRQFDFKCEAISRR